MALRVGVVLAVALTAGHLMQSLRSLPQHAVADTQAASTPTVDQLPRIAGLISVSSESTASDPACALRLDLTNAPAAMIDLSLFAPCNQGERVVVRHSGLALAETVGSDGRLRLRLPAMAHEAMVAAYVGTSEIILGKIEVPDLSDYLRVAVQMSGQARFDLRAEEGGQVFVATSASLGDGTHRITALGQPRMEDPLLAQVYSVALADFADPEMTVELRITPETCGRTLTADVILSKHGKVSQTSRNVAVPLCGTAGDILLLKNLLPDLTLAAAE